MLEPPAEQALVRRDSGVQIGNRNADVVNGVCLHLGDATALYGIIA